MWGLAKFLPEIATAIMVGILAWGAHTLDVHRIEARHLRDIQALIAADHVECEKEKAITTEVLNDLQKKATTRNRRAAAHSLQPSKCVPIVTNDTAGASGTSPGAGAAGPHGLTSSALHSFADKDQVYFDNLGSCQIWMMRVRDSFKYR